MRSSYPGAVSSIGTPVEIPFGGTHYFVQPRPTAVAGVKGGNDTFEGTSLDAPLATVSAALAKCVSGRNDVIHLIGDGTTNGSSRDTATLAWSKNATHLVGHCAPTRVSQRARIAPSSTFTPLITVSGDGCMFKNVQLWQGHNAASVCLNVTGQRNFFENVHVAGIGHATAGDDATSASLKLTGDGENTFLGCQIGIDTIARSVACAEIEFISAAVRNRFIDCDIVSFADDAAALFVKADGSGDLDRYTIFKQSRFINAIKSTATAMTEAMSVHATVGGMIILDNCLLVGADDWEKDDTGNVFLMGPGMGTSGNLNTGLAHASDAA